MRCNIEIHTIKTEEDYNNALSLIDGLLNCVEDSEGAEKLELLSILEDYKKKHYQIEAPDPISAIKQRAEQLGLTRKNLEKSIGSRGRGIRDSEQKRSLTLAMIRRLNKNLNIQPIFN